LNTDQKATNHSALRMHDRYGCALIDYLEMFRFLFLFTSFVGLATKFNLISAAVQLENLNQNEIAILQYDSRPLGDYWLASALWNKHYCDLHNHVFIYYSGNECVYDEFTKLASPWCKVKAMRQANQDYPKIKLFIYMDSDAVIDRAFEKIPANSFLKLMQSKLNWNPEERPTMFNQDGPCWWCSLITRVGYKMCLNAGW
jgi:hypothetical protein